MKDIEDKFMYGFYGVLGAFIGFLIFAIVLGGWKTLLTSEPPKPWNGTMALVLCLATGGGWGLVAYKFNDRELGSSSFESPATAILSVKRIMVVATCIVGLYFIWQLAKGL